jgi:heptosyltransferase I
MDRGQTVVGGGGRYHALQSSKAIRVPSPPTSVCILRLSALGDATHVVPMIRTLQRHRPHRAITWIIGKAEAAMLKGLDGVEFIVFDKKAGWAGVQALRATLRGRRFDALLQMQLALRANVLSTLVRADRRIGFDAARSKEGHGLVINERIAPGGYHVLDAFGQFAQALDGPQERVEWRLPVPDDAHAWAADQLPGDAPTLLVSPCSSHRLRNWRAERYAAVASQAQARGWRVVLCGGPSTLERETGDAILAAMPQRERVLDLIGRDTFKRFLALCARASILLGPDSGPAHMANAMGCRVIALHACTDAERSGPYTDRRWSPNRYAEAAERFLHKPARALPWGKRVEFEGVMDLITVDEVIERFEACAADLGR